MKARRITVVTLLVIFAGLCIWGTVEFIGMGYDYPKNGAYSTPQVDNNKINVFEGAVLLDADSTSMFTITAEGKEPIKGVAVLGRPTWSPQYVLPATVELTVGRWVIDMPPSTPEPQLRINLRYKDATTKANVDVDRAVRITPTILMWLVWAIICWGILAFWWFDDGTFGWTEWWRRPKRRRSSIHAEFGE